jgi:hypothetical protein
MLKVLLNTDLIISLFFWLGLIISMIDQLSPLLTFDAVELIAKFDKMYHWCLLSKKE